MVDYFGLLPLGYCSDLENKVEFDEDNLDFLEIKDEEEEQILVTNENQIVLQSPHSPVYIGTKNSRLRVTYTEIIDGLERITILLNYDFTTTIELPICENMQLWKKFNSDGEVEIIPIDVRDMTLDFGSAETDSQALPPLSDMFGLIRNGFCTLNIYVETRRPTQHQSARSWLAIEDHLIVLRSPDDAHWLGENTGTYILKSVGPNGRETKIYEEDFVVFISDPNCHDIRILERAELDPMEIFLGDVTAHFQ